MALPDTQKVKIDQTRAFKPGWYNAVLIGHVEKSDQSVISSHIEFELTDTQKRIWAMLSHDQDSLALIKRLKQALGMNDADTDLNLYYNKALKVYVDNIFKDGIIINEVKDFDKYENSPKNKDLEKSETAVADRRKFCILGMLK
jgi:hypothetical protein